MGLVPLEGFAKAKKVKQIAEIYIKLVELKKRREVANVCFICSIGSCVHILHISFFPFLVSLLVTCCINSESNIKGSGASLALSLLRKDTDKKDKHFSADKKSSTIFMLSSGETNGGTLY
ncbi:PREDICTED: uncharacterized protein LOC104807539 isoform X3 [Tarenaya hassleriana]|uniref:uncharacterized protein LOC104807539 isoform X3 n=1 Tax=Tarenaya hassleriana TaxID=28532 RepID=UPI0008FD869E|nr:PREDICTED: uncharacterized protein LOC104807539 isoform X3 [Tarenaya hassleriana]